MNELMAFGGHLNKTASWNSSNQEAWTLHFLDNRDLYCQKFKLINFSVKYLQLWNIFKELITFLTKVEHWDIY